MNRVYKVIPYQIANYSYKLNYLILFNMVNITKVYKRERAHIHAHTDVYINNEYVGYYIRSKKTYRDESLQWFFVAEPSYQLENFSASNIKDIMKLLKSHFEWRETTCYMKVGI